MLSLISNLGIQLADVDRESRTHSDALVATDVSSEILDQRYDRQNPQHRE
jgi:hypothetical protein